MVQWYFGLSVIFLDIFIDFAHFMAINEHFKMSIVGLLLFHNTDFKDVVILILDFNNDICFSYLFISFKIGHWHII